MSQNQNKPHLQQQLDHHHLQQQQHHLHQQQLLHHHHQQQQQQRQWHQQYQQQQLHHQHQQQQQHAQYAAAAAAHAHVASVAATATSMRVGNGMPGIYGNSLARGGGGCLYDTSRSLIPGGGGVGVGVGYDLDMAGHHVGSRSSSITATSTTPLGGSGVGYMPPNVNFNPVGGGIYNAGMPAAAAATESGRRASAGICGLYTSPHQPQPSAQHQLQQQRLQQQQIIPPEGIKMEPLEQIHTPTIEMDELIIKTEPTDGGYNKVSMSDDAIAKATTNIHSNAGYMNFPKHLQPYPQQQQQQQQQLQQKQQLQHQQQLRQQQQEQHQQQLRRQQQDQHQQQLRQQQQQLRQQQQEQQRVRQQQQQELQQLQMRQQQQQQQEQQHQQQLRQQQQQQLHLRQHQQQQHEHQQQQQLRQQYQQEQEQQKQLLRKQQQQEELQQQKQQEQQQLRQQQQQQQEQEQMRKQQQQQQQQQQQEELQQQKQKEQQQMQHQQEQEQQQKMRQRQEIEQQKQKEQKQQEQEQQQLREQQQSQELELQKQNQQKEQEEKERAQQQQQQLEQQKQQQEKELQKHQAQEQQQRPQEQDSQQSETQLKKEQQQQQLRQERQERKRQQEQTQAQLLLQQDQEQQEQQMLSHDAMAEAGLLTVKLEPQINIKEEIMETSQNKPLNFPRRKVQTERSDTPPICQRCKQVFFKKQSYTKHVSQSLCEIVEYDFKCSICPMSFTSSEELQEHEQLHRENMYFCHKYCGKYFDTIELCEVHEYMHHEYVNYICNICSAGFASREQLFSHMPQHRNQARYDCPICRLWFHTAIQLHQHRISAPYFCGKFYKAEGAASAYDRTPPPSHATNYNLQDCSMGVIEMPGSDNNSFSSILQNRAFHHQQQQHSQHTLQHPKYHTQQHLQRQQQHMHFQTPQQNHRPPPSPQRRHAALAQPDFMRRNSYGSVGGGVNDFHMPQIKTEIKIEPDTFASPEFPLQTPLPPPPLPPPPLSTHQSALASPSRQRRFGDYSNESFGGGDSSLSFGSNSNSNDFLNGSNMQRNLNSSSNSNQFSPNFHFPTTPSSPRTRTADPDEAAICCVPHCGVNKQASPTLQFFTFPKDDKYLHQWLHNLKMLPEPNSDYSQYRICSLHFPKRCINRYSLCYWAVPTFNLGHDDVANLYQNREITNTFTIGERAQCSMPGCPSQRGESNCKFYNFPNDMKTRIKWCQNARLPVHSKEPRHFCSRHFEERCFGKFRLKPWAVPTLHLGTPYGRIHDNPGVFYLEEKKCCLPHCKRTRSSDFNLSLYRFPRDEVLLRRWCYNLRLDPSVYRGKNHKICSAHFIKEALGLRKLSPGAVPTLNLGHNDRFNIYENELPTPPPAAVPAPKMFNFHNVSTPPSPYNSHQRHSMGSGSSQSGRMYANPVSGLKFSISNITASDMSGMSHTSTQNILDSIDVCFVPNCKRNRNIDNVTLHTIPRRPDQMRKWCHNLKIPVDSLHKGVRICSAHFEPYCIGGCMRPFAVPTLNLGHDDPNIYRNPDVIKKLNIRETCCVQDCRRNRDRDRANLHRFPSNLEMLTKWCENLLKPVPDGTKLFNDAICERHFDERCIRSKRLEKWAVPTVKLGHNEEPKHSLPTDEEIAELWPKPLMPNRGGEDGECCVRTCRRDPKVDDIKLYRTPEEPEVLAKWAHNLQVETEDLTTLRICNLHFEEHCFSKKRRLQDWALPTLNLATNVEQLYENPEPSVPLAIRKAEERRERRRMQRDSNEPAKPWKPRCCLPHCRKRRGTDLVQLFRFPVLNRSMLAKWCHNLQLPLVGNGHRRICSSHFEPRVLSKRCPIPMSVPTIDLNTPPGYKIYTNPARLKAVKLGLQQTCCISSCNRTRADGVQLFRYPHSRTLLRKWCHNTRQQAREVIRGQYRVCSRHFEPHSFGAKRLMPRAIPTLNLDPEVEDAFANEAQSFAETQCVVSGCVATKELDGVRLFKFPYDDEDLLWKWCNNLKLNPIDCRGVRICNRHFEDECVGPKNIYKWSIPTLALGHNDPDIKLVPVPPPEERYNDVVTKCCVPTCGKSRKYDDAQMNSFPKELRLFRAWKHNLKLDYLDFKDRDKFKICSDHFEPVCLGKGRLNYGAIPTLNLGHDDTDDLYTVDPAQLQVSLFGKMRPCATTERDVADAVDATAEKDDSFKCSYPNCNATKMLLREPYDMPSALPLHALWCAQMKVDTEALSETPKLCGLHFIKLYKSTLDAANALAEGDDDLSEALKSLSETFKKCCESPTVCSAQCCVAGCGSNQVSGSRTAQRLYLFPAAASSGAELNEKWCQNVGVETADLSRYQHRVCARHFEPKCIGPTQRLRSWAVPTLHLKHKTESEIHPIPELGSAVRPHEARCCVPACARERGDFETMRLFSFPLIEEVLEKWLHNLQLTRNECARLRICDQHFETRCITKGRILRWAVPTLLLERKAEELLQSVPPVQAASSAAQMAKEKAASKNAVKDTNEALDDADDDGSGELTVVPNVKIKKSLDTVKCCVSSCKRSRLKHGARLFPFPTSQQMVRKWCHNLKMPIEKLPAASLRICSLHFHKRCIDGKQLRPWAKPTNELGHTGPIFDNNKNLPGVFLPKCCLPHCRQRRTLENHLRTFGFPKDPVLMEKWCSNLHMKPRLLHARICMTHFEPEAMGNKKLRANAVPTLNLGHNEPLKYDNKALIASAPPKAEKSNLLEETKMTASDAEKDDDADEEEDEEQEQEEENDLYATADVVNSDEEEAVENFTPSVSGATGYDDESCSNAIASKARIPNANSDDDDNDDEVYGNGEDDENDSSDEENEGAGKHMYEDGEEDEDDESDSESEEDIINDESKDVDDDDDDDDDDDNIEMLIDDEDDKNNDCDPLDFLECVTKKSGKKLAANKNVRKRPISTTPAHYDYDGSYTNFSNADENTRFTTATSNSATATTSYASASATASVSNDARRHGREKISRSVFRLSCLKHRRKKKAPPDPPPPDKQQNARKAQTISPTQRMLMANKSNITNISQQRLQQKRRINCAVRRCGRLAGASVPLYSFPPLGSRYCRYWCAQLNVKMLQTPRLRICQRHFAYSLIDRRSRRLRFGAIPTRNLYSNTINTCSRDDLVASSTKVNETKPFVEQATPYKVKTLTDLNQPSSAQLSPYHRCCVPHCGKTHQDDGVTLFSFPKLRSLYLQWTTNLRLKPTARLVQVYKVCSEHFEQNCLSVHRSRTALQYGSVPTLKLGHAEDLQNLNNSNTSISRKRRNKIGPKVKRKTITGEKPANQKGVHECAVHDCRVAQFLQMQLFPLPDVQKLQERWCNYFKLNINSSTSENSTKFFQNVRLCALHYMEGYQMATYSDGAPKGTSAAYDMLEANYARITSSTRIQMMKCCVPNCSTKFTDNVRLTAFPRAAELRAKWQHNTQVTFSPTHRYLYRACALHFEERCYAKKRLHLWAVPTLNLPPPRNKDPKHRIYENPTIDVVGTSHCCVEGCTTTEDKKDNAAAAAEQGERTGVAPSSRLWHFPLDQGLREKWLHNLGITADAQNISHTSRRWRICGRHFEDYCFGKGLRAWAVPTLHLPKPKKLTKSGKRSTFIYQNPDSAIHFYRCCIKTCGQQRDIDAGIRLYGFPKKDTMLQKWAHNLRMPAVKCRHARICTLHFEAQCMRPQMQPWALPTIALGHEEADIFRNPKVKLKVTNGRCCLPHCNKCRSSDNVRLFAFPRDEQVLKKWWHNLAIAAQDAKHRLICDTHFEPRCISLRRLKRWAIPTLNLGHTNEILENPTPTEVLAFENTTNTRRSQTPSKTVRIPKAAATTPGTTVKCAITACESGSDAGTLYRFPKPDWLRKKWCDNTRLDEEAAKTAKLCARHFETQVMGNHKPRPWALPTLELGVDEHGAPLAAVHANPKQLSRFHPEEHEWGELRYVRANHCSIISCMKSKGDGVILFNYPTNQHMLKKWAENCRHYAYQAKRYRFQLCGAHFTADCFKREGTRLRKGAVPTLNLGHDDEHIHQSKFENVVMKSSVQKRCSVPQCGRTSEHDGVRLFKFPNERPEILEKWCHNLRFKATDCHQALICNMHFEARCIGPIRLLHRAIPTLLLGHNDTVDNYENPETFGAPEKVISCCVPGCNNTKTTEGVVMSAFPKLRSQFEKWAHNLRLPVTSTVWHTYKVCSAHFESYCYEHGRIKVGALPTLKLGHDDTADLYVTNEETMSYARKRKLMAPKNELTKAPQETCCYPDCREVELRLSHSLYELPAVNAIRRAWLKAMSLCDEEQLKPIKEEYVDIKDEAVSTLKNVGGNAEIDNVLKRMEIVAKTENATVNDVVASTTKPTETSHKICPIHFRILYMKHQAMLQELQLKNQPEITHCLQELENTFKIASDLSCVRRICCAVPGCNSNLLTTPTIRYNKFPDNPDTRTKWCHNTQVTVDTDRLYCYKVCELHFDPVCISQLAKKKQRVKAWAIPTLNLPPRTDDMPEIYPLPALDTLPETKRNLLMHAAVNKCYIPSCVNAKPPEERGEENDSDVQFFNFPNHAELLYKWVFNTEISMVAAAHARICSLHFEKHCINKRLRMYAVPTLNLGHSRTDIYENPAAKRTATAVELEVKDEETLADDESKDEAVGEDAEMKVKKEEATDEEEEAAVKKSISVTISKKRKISARKKMEKAEETANELKENTKGKLRKKRKLGISKISEQAEADLKEESKSDMKASKKQIVKLLANTEKTDQKEEAKEEAKVCKKLVDKLEPTTEKSYPQEEPKVEVKVSKKLADKLEATQKTTLDKPYHKPFVLNVKEEETDGEDEVQNDGDCMESQMKQGLLDIFHSFGDTADDIEYEEDADQDVEDPASKNTTARHCRIKGCNAYLRDPGVTLFKFPCSHEQFRKWLHNTQLEVDYTRRWRYRVCNRHFEPICTEFRKLPAGSMPTLNLGPTRPAKIYDNEFNATALQRYRTKKQRRVDRKTDTELQQQQLAITSTLDYDETATSSSFAAEGMGGPQPGENTDTVGEQPNEDYDDIDDNEDYAVEANVDYDMMEPNDDEYDMERQEDYAGALDVTPVERDTSRHCRIPDCNSHAKDPNVTLFKFPLSEYLFRKWLHNTQLKVDYNRRWRYRICQRHFEPICMQFRKLPPGTMPTLNLGPSRPARIYENCFDVNHLKKFKPKPPTTATTATTTVANTTKQTNHFNEEAETNSSFALTSHEAQLLPYNNNEVLPSTQLSCAIRNCSSIYQRNEGLHLHKLPTNVTLREKWIYNCRLRKDALASMSSRIRICTLHFTANCFFGQRRQLKFGAVPTLRLGHTDANIYTDGFSNAGEAAQHEITQSTVGGGRHDICCLINCTRSGREYTRHFAFPTEKKILEKWLSALGMEFNSARSDDYKICEWHFKSSDFDGEVLLADAVPTRYLKVEDANQTDDEDDGRYDEDEDDELAYNTNEEPLDECPSTSAAAAAAAATDDGKKLLPGARRCCLSHCRKQIYPDMVRTFKFPATRDQFLKWIHNLGVDYDGSAPWRYQICNEHFEEKCIIKYDNKSKLFRWAVPTLNLGKNAPAILFTSDRPNQNKMELKSNDFGRDNFRNINAAEYLNNDDMYMDTTNDESSNALPIDKTTTMVYQEEDVGLLAPIQRTQLKQNAPTKQNTNTTVDQNIAAPNNDYNATDDDDYVDDAYDDDNENSLLDVIREEKPTPVTEGTPASTFYTQHLLRGRTFKERACCLAHCGRTRSTGVRLFRFPTEPVFLQRWEYNFRVRFNGAQRNTHLICSLHFERDQYNKRLVVDAIPTLNLGHNSNDIYRNGQCEPLGAHRSTMSPQPLTPIAQQTTSSNNPALSAGGKLVISKTLKCNVPACTQTRRRLFPFPNNMGFVKIWTERTQIAYDARQHAELRVCDLHFEADCFSAQGLNNNAVPTLYLPAPTPIPLAALTTTTAATTNNTVIPANRPMVAAAAAATANPTTSAPTQMPKLSAIACSVINCGNNTATRPDLKIFSKFPDDFELFTKWCFNLKIDPRTYVNGAYNVCSEHFEPFCIGGHSLRVWAVPTLRLGHNSKLIHSVERPAEVEMRCCLPHCGRNKSKDGVEFYNFPKGDIYRQWCQILRIDEGLYRNTDKKICSAHFRSDCFNSNGTLRQGARPTLLLRNRTPTAAAHILKPPAPYRSKCIVRTCHEMQQLYSFPAQRILCTKWCHNLKIDYYPKLHENMNFKICRRHFEPNCLLSGGKLHVEAVPTVQLGHNDINIYQNLIGMKNSANTPSYDDNSSLRTSVSTVHTWLMDVDAETNAHMPAPSHVGGVVSGGGLGGVSVRRMQYEPPVELEPITVDADDDDMDDDDAVGVVNDNMDLSNNTYMPIEDDSYGENFGEPRLLPQSSTFIAAESTEIIDLDDVDAVQEQFPNWSHQDAVLVDDDDDDAVDNGDAALLWSPLN